MTLNFNSTQHSPRIIDPETTPLNNTKLRPLMFFILIPVISLMLLISTHLLLALELPYPDPLLPKNGSKDVDITAIIFSWKPFYAGTEEYTFELSTTFDMNTDVFKAITKNGMTTYVYKGNLKYGTTYWWRVMATKPLGGEWSPVSNFTTKIDATGGANNPSQSNTSSKSPFSSIIYTLEEVGWPVVGGIATGIIILVIVLLMLLRKPGYAGNPGIQPGMSPFMQHQNQPVCQVCGISNDPSRKFCSNCGTAIQLQRQQASSVVQHPSSCPRCNTINPPQQQYCMNCGNNLTTMMKQQPINQAELKICSKCGSLGESSQRFCGKCGGNLIDAQQKSWQVYQTYSCPFCGSQVSSQTNPCPGCGNWLNWGI